MESLRVGDYLEAFTKMRSGALLMIIGALLAGLGVLLVFLALPMAFIPGPPGPVVGVGAILASIILLIILILVGAVLSLVGMIAKFIPGTSKLAEVNPEFSTVATLIKIGYIVGLDLMIIGGLTLVILVGFFLIIVAYVFLLIGTIGLIILCFKPNDLEKETLYLVAGIIFIIGIFVGITSFTGWILIYVALGHSISRRTAQPSYGVLPAQSI